MSEKTDIKTYFNKGKFVIPAYQRGYKWSVKDQKNKSSLDFFIDSLVKAFEDRHNEYFIEAVTVVEENKEIILVDGQQRTTSLFLIFVVLKGFEFVKNKLKYDVREDSHKWLNNLISDNKVEIEDDDTQDIFYFKEALKLIESKLEGVDQKEFSNFIKENVYLLYNPIPKEKAVNTFIALNGLKAVMKDEELIKSDLLIKSSRIEDKSLDKEEQFGIEWKINEDRGRLARNWDKWLYWWNKDEVKKYFSIGNHHPLYYLLVTYWKINNIEKGKTKDFSFDNFKTQFISNSQEAKKHFEGLRKLQKTFEDLYADWELYNLLGLAISSAINKEDVMIFFIQNRKKKDELKRFAKWSLVGCTLKEITENNKIAFNEKRDNLKSLLEEQNLYESEGKKQAYLQLLRMNVLDMNNRKFDFEVFKTKSLEHICPQNPSETDTDFINSKNEIDEKSDSINSIGNLVLLNGSANSSLSNNPYNKKKQLLFDKIKEGFLLPHTLKVFSKSFEVTSDKVETERLFNNEKYWQAEDVKNNKKYFFNEFDNYYGK